MAMAGRARFPTITGWTNSTATWRASERAAGERPNAIRRPPRANRSAMRWHSRASALGVFLEERVVGPRAALEQRLKAFGLLDGERRMRHAATSSRAAIAQEPFPPRVDAVAGPRAE